MTPARPKIAQLPPLLLLALATGCAHHPKTPPKPAFPMEKAVEAAHRAVVQKGQQSEATAEAAHYFAQIDGKGWKILVRFAPTFGRDAGYAIVTIDAKGKVTNYKTGG